MSSARWLSAVSLAFAGAAVLLAGGAASAQVLSSSNPSSSDAVTVAESSSSEYNFIADAPDAAEPGTPAPAAGAAAGQYDNKSGGYRGFLSRLTYEAGGGFNAPSSDSSSYITWGGNFTVGGGMRFSHGVSLLAEYQFIDDKLPGAVIAETGATGGNAHIWSLGLSPVINLFPKRTNSLYVTGGGGFYRKVTNFTNPEPTEYCTYYYCGIGYQNAVVGHFSSNQGGWNVGAAFTHRLGGAYGDGKTMIFAEARYLQVLTPAVSSSPNGLGTATLAANTKLIPVTFGVRF
jgi:hypothetical protein